MRQHQSKFSKKSYFYVVNLYAGAALVHHGSQPVLVRLAAGWRAGAGDAAYLDHIAVPRAIAAAYAVFAWFGLLCRRHHSLPA